MTDTNQTTQQKSLDERKHELREHLNATRESLLTLIAGLQPEDWERKVQGDDGQWTLRQVMLHLASSETGQIATGRAIVEGAQLEVIDTPGQAWCMQCMKNVAVQQRYDACPDCGGFQLQVNGGEEMRIKELEVE